MQASGMLLLLSVLAPSLILLLSARQPVVAALRLCTSAIHARLSRHTGHLQPAATPLRLRPPATTRFAGQSCWQGLAFFPPAPFADRPALCMV